MFILLYKIIIDLKLNKIGKGLYISFGVPQLMEVLFCGKFKMEKFSDDIQKTLVSFTYKLIININNDILALNAMGFQWKFYKHVVTW